MSADSAVSAGAVGQLSDPGEGEGGGRGGVGGGGRPRQPTRGSDSVGGRHEDQERTRIAQ